MKKPWGDMKKTDIELAKDAPYGKAKEIIRKYDPLWGASIGELKKYKIKLCRQKIEYEVAETEIMAPTKESARVLAGEIDPDCLDWEWDDEETKYPSVDSVTEVKS